MLKTVLVTQGCFPYPMFPVEFNLQFKNIYGTLGYRLQVLYGRSLCFAHCCRFWLTRPTDVCPGRVAKQVKDSHCIRVLRKSGAVGMNSTAQVLLKRTSGSEKLQGLMSLNAGFMKHRSYSCPSVSTRWISDFPESQLKLATYFQ